MSVNLLPEGKAKFFLVLGLGVWATCATVWLLVLSAAAPPCPMARIIRADHDPANATATPSFLGLGLNVTASSISIAEPTSAVVTPTAEPRAISGRQLLERYHTEIYKKKTDKNCTMVMLTYKREKMLPRVLKHYCKVKQLQRILVVWNDIDTPVPPAMFELTKEPCHAEIKFLVPRENKLTNRYLPRSEIETDCVCLMDDDRIVQVEDMEFGFEVWKSNRHRIVGFEERSFIKNSQGKYIYTNYERRRFLNIASNKADLGSNLPPGYSLEIRNGTRYLHVRNKTYILGSANSALSRGSTVVRKSEDGSKNETKKSEGYNIMLNSCFLHRAYLEMYFDPQMVPGSLLDYVDSHQNCEDILMSIVVTKFLKDIGRPQCGALAVKSGYINNLEDEARDTGGREGLSSRPDHYAARSSCLEKFATTYGYLPLHTSRLIMAKVTYR